MTTRAKMLRDQPTGRVTIGLRLAFLVPLRTLEIRRSGVDPAQALARLRADQKRMEALTLHPGDVHTMDLMEERRGDA